MIKDVKRKYFEIWGTEEAQNAVLKGFVVYLSLIIFAETATISFLSLRKPILIGVSSSESMMLTVTPPKEEYLKSELQRVVSNYAKSHYTWDSGSIEVAHREAGKYIADQFQKTYFKANEEQVRFVKEKKVSQKVYLSAPPQVDLKAMAARVRLDRIYSIDGMSGSAPISLDIRFEYGQRTETNPEGIYINDEKLVSEEGVR